MTEYTETVTVDAGADDTFGFVSDVENLPKYLNTVHAAHSHGGERIEVEGQAHDKPYQAEGWFKTDPSARTMRWGSDGQSSYSGTMRVTGDGSRSHVTCTLTFAGGEEQARVAGDADREIQRGLAASLQSIKQLVEGTGGKTTTSAET